MGENNVYTWSFEFDSGLTGEMEVNIKNKKVTQKIPNCTLEKAKKAFDEASKIHTNDSTIRLEWTELISELEKKPNAKVTVTRILDDKGNYQQKIGQGKAKFIARKSDLIKELVSETVTSVGEYLELSDQADKTAKQSKEDVKSNMKTVLNQLTQEYKKL